MSLRPQSGAGGVGPGASRDSQSLHSPCCLSPGRRACLLAWNTGLDTGPSPTGPSCRGPLFLCSPGPHGRGCQQETQPAAGRLLC